jgi:hypothetical protein
MSPEHGTRPITVPDGLGTLVIRHSIENIDLKAGKNRRGAAEHADVEFWYKSTGLGLRRSCSHGTPASEFRTK